MIPALDKLPKGFGESNVLSIFNWAYGMAALTAVIFIVVAGISYATANGDPAKIQKAHRTILFSVIGLIVVLLAAAITNFVFMTVVNAE